MDPLADTLPLAQRITALLQRFLDERSLGVPLEQRPDYAEFADLVQQAHQMAEQKLQAVREQAEAKAAEIQAKAEQLQARRTAPPPPPAPPLLALEFEAKYAPPLEAMQRTAAELSALAHVEGPPRE